jgi:peptidoglycan hydrolase FlgJ
MNGPHPVAELLGSTPAPAHSPHRLARAAQDFEGMLLGSLLSPLEKSFSALPGEGSQAGSEQYGYLGVQALASALSKSGGLGLADLVVRQLRSTEVPGDTFASPGRGLCCRAAGTGEPL